MYAILHINVCSSISFILLYLEIQLIYLLGIIYEIQHTSNDHHYELNREEFHRFLLWYLDIIKRRDERDSPKTTRLRRPHWPQTPLESVFRENRNRRRNRRFKGSDARQNPSYLSSFIGRWSIVTTRLSVTRETRCDVKVPRNRQRYRIISRL